VSVCPSCGHRNQPGAKFCSECGTALAAARPASYEERKVVTVLFADLVGFTSRAEQLDPEDVRALLSPFYARLRAELERFGGTVEKFIGDAVMALFGAPVAHEDDPERAVRAALAIRDWVAGEERIQVRLAVNTGEALVVLGARPSEGEGMAAGDVVNTAARLQAAAPTANAVPSRMTSMAAAVASRAWVSLVFGSSIDQEQSMMMISAAPAGDAGPSATEPADVTVTMALTSRAPSGRYSFWKISTVKSGALIVECSCGFDRCK
jgi:class 3 adenylate cyclase